jgi:hypothetical protein
MAIVLSGVVVSSLGLFFSERGRFGEVRAQLSRYYDCDTDFLPVLIPSTMSLIHRNISSGTS